VAPTGRSSVAFVIKFWSICVLLALGIALGFGAGLGTAIYIRVSWPLLFVFGDYS
jgi:hypothetical protein